MLFAACMPVSQALKLLRELAVVQDDGVEFELAARRDSGHGLRNIAARARELGASSEVVSAPGKGTRVLVSVPLEQPA